MLRGYGLPQATLFPPFRYATRGRMPSRLVGSARGLGLFAADATDEIVIVVAGLALLPPVASGSGAFAIDKRHDADAQHAGRDRRYGRIVVFGSACFVFAGDGRRHWQPLK